LRFCAGVSSPKSVSRACRRNSGDGVALDIILGKQYIYDIIAICFIILMIIIVIISILMTIMVIIIHDDKNSPR
jgi:hypothetical protein